MFTPEQQAAYQRATDLLTEANNGDLRGQLPDQIRSFILPWRPAFHVGVHIPDAADLLTLEVIRWFHQRGWLACSFRQDILAAPFVETAVPHVCFHTTPANNETGILTRGLLRGVDAGRTTTGRDDAAQRIHVTFEAGTASQWSKDKLLGKHNPSGAWVMFQIEGRGIEGKVYRDPASQTGYILEAPRVAPEFLKVAERWNGE
jgi:hypothetical protein